MKGENPRKKKESATSDVPPCKHRKREVRYGVRLDWCDAIGFETKGDLPCICPCSLQETCARLKKTVKGKKKVK